MSDHGSQRTGSPSVYAPEASSPLGCPAIAKQYEDNVTPLSVISRLTSDGAAASGTPYQAWLSAALEPLTLTRYTGQEP